MLFGSTSVTSGRALALISPATLSMIGTNQASSFPHRRTLIHYRAFLAACALFRFGRRARQPKPLFWTVRSARPCLSTRSALLCSARCPSNLTFSRRTYSAFDDNFTPICITISRSPLSIVILPRVIPTAHFRPPPSSAPLSVSALKKGRIHTHSTLISDLSAPS